MVVAARAFADLTFLWLTTTGHYGHQGSWEDADATMCMTNKGFTNGLSTEAIPGPQYAALSAAIALTGPTRGSQPLGSLQQFLGSLQRNLQRLAPPHYHQQAALWPMPCLADDKIAPCRCTPITIDKLCDAWQMTCNVLGTAQSHNIANATLWHVVHEDDGHVFMSKRDAGCITGRAKDSWKATLS